MKNKLHIIFLAFVIGALSLMTVSCIKDNVANEDGEALLGVNVKTYSPATEDDQVLGQAEYIIRRARLYAFDGNVLDNMVYLDNLSNTTGIQTLQMKVKQSPNKTLYVILNEPDDALIHSRLALINNPSAFSQIEYDIADYVNQAYNYASTFDGDAFCLPMFGKETSVDTQTSTPDTEISVAMEATRSLARVDVMIQKLSTVDSDVKITSATKLSIKNTRTLGYIAPGIDILGDLVDQSNVISGDASPLSARVRKDDLTTADLAFTFYTPEHDCSADADKLAFTLADVDFGGKLMDFEITIGNSAGNILNKIERNKVHKIYCTFTPKEIEVTLNILDWNDVNVGGDIYGSRLDLTASKMVMDWWNLGFRYDTCVSFDADEDVTLVGYYVDGEETTEMPDWLTLTAPTFPAKQGTFYLDYTPTPGIVKDDTITGYHPDLVIKLRSGNIEETITVIYDNGFLSRDLIISKGWNEQIPLVGVHLSKIRCSHPKDNTGGSFIYNAYEYSGEIYDWQDNRVEAVQAYELAEIGVAKGFGKGPINTDNWVAYNGGLMEPATYVRTYLGIEEDVNGEAWYLPSLLEAEVVFSLNDYLGYSYLFSKKTAPHIQDNQVITSTTSLPTKAYYCVGKAGTGDGFGRLCDYSVLSHYINTYIQTRGVINITEELNPVMP